MQQLVTEAKAKIRERQDQLAVDRHSLQEKQRLLSAKEVRREEIKTRVHRLVLAREAIQQIVNLLSVKNIQRIEGLINTALETVFFDMNLKFKIDQGVKRGITTYTPVIIEDGREGSWNSSGGGVVALISFVLKSISNRISGVFPALFFDESLAMLADKYIPACASMIKELAKELDIPITLVTHQRLFAEEADREIRVDKSGSETIIEVI